MRHYSATLLVSLLTYATALPTDPSSSALLPRQDGTVTDTLNYGAYLSAPSPITISNSKSIRRVICSTSASTTRYSSSDITYTFILNAGDITDRYPGDTADPNQSDLTSVFSLVGGTDPSVAQADPAFRPIFAKGCDTSKALFWGKMGSLRGPHPMDIGVFNVVRSGIDDGKASATFCGVMTNSHTASGEKNKYQLCNPEQ